MNPTGRTPDFDPGAIERHSYEIPASTSRNPETYAAELARKVEEAYLQHDVSPLNADPGYASSEDVSRTDTYSQYETLQPRRLTVAEETNNLIVLRQAALDNKLVNPVTDIQVSTNPAAVPVSASGRRSDHVKAA